MKVKSHILIILLLFMMLFVCIGSVSALENQTDDIVENEVISVSESPEILTASEQIGTGGNVNLTKGNCAYAEGDGDTIEISASGVIDGNDEVIGMADDGIGSDDGKISVQTVNDAKSAVDGAAEVDSQNALAVSDEDSILYSSFKDLQSLIDAAPEGSEITLNNNYSLDDNGKSIKISKSITINGNGTTLNANVHDRIISIEADNKEIVLKNIKFENGHLEKSVGAAYGGAISNTHASTSLTIINCEFNNNKIIHHYLNPLATVGGGAIYTDGQLNITSSRFTNNHAAHRGGAIYCTGKCTITSTEFKKNNGGSYEVDGGAIHADEITIENCNFTGNAAFKGTDIHRFGNGGAIYAKTSVQIRNSSFNENHADIDGGAIFCKGKTTIYNSNFTKNTASVDIVVERCFGGAILSEKETTIENCKFENNHAYNHGGAIYAYAKITIKKSDFTGNSAKQAGAVYAGTTSGFVNSVFLNNIASDGDGGAIYINNNCNPEFTSCRFERNTATNRGGAIYLDSKTAHLKATYCTFVDNHADKKDYSGSGYFYGAGHSIFNSGYYDLIDMCWFGTNNPQFGETFVEHRTSASDRNYTPSNYLEFGLMMELTVYENEIYVGNPYKLTVYMQPSKGEKDFLHSPVVYSGDGNFSNFKDNSYNMSADVVFTKENAVVYAKLDNQVSSKQFYPVNKKSDVVKILSCNNATYPGSVVVEFTIVDFYSYEENATYVITDEDAGVINFKGNISEDNYGILSFDKLASGNYSITITYPETWTTSLSNDTAFFTVNKGDVELNITVFDEVYPQDVEGIVYASVDGHYTLNIGNYSSVLVVRDGVAYFNAGTLDAGTYGAIVSFAGDENHNPASNSTKFVVNASGTLFEIEINASEITYGETVTVSHIISDGATGNITYFLNDGTFIGMLPVDENLTLPVLPARSYVLIANYSGDKDFPPASDVASFIVNKAPNSVVVSADDVAYGEKTVISVSADVDGVYAVDVNGSIYNLTVVGGIGNKTVALNAGSYYANATFNNKNYESYVRNTTFNVNKVDSTLSVDDVVMDYGDSVNVTVKTEGSTGITAKVDGNDVAVNDYVITISDLAVGNHTLAVTTIVDANHNSVTKTAVIVVNKKDLTLNATIFDVIGNATLMVTGFENATGNVTITIGDDNYTTPIMMGMTFLSIPKLNETVTAYIYYPGDDNYNNASTTVDIIAKKNLNLTASADPIYIGQNATLIVTGFENATGNVMVMAGKGFYNVTIIDGTVTVTIPGLNQTTEAYVIYAGDENYNIAFTSVNITVNPKENATISIDAPSEAIEGDNVTVTVTLPSDATGSVTIGNEIVSVKNGTASAVLTNLPAGNITVPVTYSGDDKYNPIETEVNITVKEDTSDIISAPDVTKYYGGSERFVVTVTDYESNPLANKTVKIYINGREYARTTDENGTASMAIGLPSNTYNVTVTVDNQTVKSVVTVLSTVNGTDVVKMYRNGTQYYATFRDREGKYLADGTVVNFNINGVFYERKVSGDKGQAKLNINLPAGEYVITAMNPVTGENAANNITVLATIVENKDITKFYKNGTQYTVKVLGADGKAVGAGENVTFNVNGVFYTRQTNASGIVTLNINLPEGEYVITAEYKGYKVANNIKVLPVLTAKDLVKKYGTPDQFVATLVDGQGKPYAEQKVAFNVNGQLYNKAADSAGQAKLDINLPAGEYIITSSYNGCNIANKITISG